MKFEKVTLEQYCKDCGYETDLIDGIEGEYNDIPLPKRATLGSAGYDFSLPFSIDLEPNETIVIPTGIRWVCSDDEFNGLKQDGMGLVLEIAPRSGLGFKNRLRLNNTIGEIDMDYSLSDNEGHIMIKLSNEGDTPLHLDKGKGFAQGIIKIFICTEDDEQLESENPTKRNGGFSSTDEEQTISDEWKLKLP